MENVRNQYERMMEEYPESMGRVLMLYVGTTVNGKSLQVFVNSGAQATILSSACADGLDLLHLVDERFAGVAAGVGTGKILGRIHVVEMDIGGCVFPCSVTVMYSEGGLGDKNMDCLLGLDMLKRHRCRRSKSKRVYYNKWKSIAFFTRRTVVTSYRRARRPRRSTAAFAAHPPSRSFIAIASLLPSLFSLSLFHFVVPPPFPPAPP